MRPATLSLAILLLVSRAQAQQAFGRLPIGAHAVGFKVLTFEDSSRLTGPDRNVLGEPDQSNKNRKINLQIWYPAQQRGNEPLMTLQEYVLSSSKDKTNQSIDSATVTGRINALRDQLQNFFGKVDEARFQNMLTTRMLAGTDAKPANERFPLLIGMLRQFSTTITNELLASHGFIVVMVRSSNLPTGPNDRSLRYIDEVQDMRAATQLALRFFKIDEHAIGTFGFSGSGFTQLLYSMNDFRPKAVADLESGLYMDGLWQSWSVCNLYNVNNLRIPFLHMFSRDLSRQEKFISEFEKTKFSERYQLILNQPGLHHWDFATEGMISCALLKMRGAKQENIQSSFELANLYLLNFFQHQLKHDKGAARFLHQKQALKNYQDSLWSIKILPALKPAPSAVEFTELINKVGVDEAIRVVDSTLKNDSSTNLLEGFILNRIGYNYLDKQQKKEAVAVFKLNTRLHPAEPNWEDSLLEALIADGKNDEAKQVYETLLDKIDKSSLPSDAKENMRKRANKLIQKR